MHTHVRNGDGRNNDYATDEKRNEDTKIRVNWRILTSLSRVARINHSVKHYLDEYVQSRFLQIKYPDSVTASLLPVERFEGANKQKVWPDSRKVS